MQKKIKYIVIDMYTSYISLIKDCFSNAKIIINCMKKNKENYRKFKRYQRLLLTSRFDSDCSSWEKYLCFKNLMTEVDIVDYLVNLNPKLKASYNLYQNVLYVLQNKNY